MTPDQNPDNLLNPPSGADRNVPVQLTPDGPITAMKESALARTAGVFEDDNELTHWVEYRLPETDPTGPVVHRSAWVQLKKPAQPLLAEAGAFA